MSQLNKSPSDARGRSRSNRIPSAKPLGQRGVVVKEATCSAPSVHRRGVRTSVDDMVVPWLVMGVDAVAKGHPARDTAEILTSCCAQLHGKRGSRSNWAYPSSQSPTGNQTARMRSGVR